MTTCEDILRIIDRKAPFYRAEEWDNVGLLIGDPNQKVERVLFALDVTQQTVEEAVKKKADLIVSHHPVLFSPVKNIRWDRYTGKLLKDLIGNGISVISAHTNVDMYPMGINGFLAEKLGLSNCMPLRASAAENYYKLVVFVPEDYTEEVLTALFEAGAGKLGLYEACAFRQEGVGQFKPIGSASPFIGTQDVLEMVDETRLEVLVPYQAAENVEKALLESHPYEEPAYDLFLLQNKQDRYGLGVVGDLETSQTLEGFLDRVKEFFGLKRVRHAGRGKDRVQRIAICSGSGGDLMKDANDLGADLYITSDLKYHDGQKAFEEELIVLDVGHHASEIFTKGLLMAWIEEGLSNDEVELFVAEKENDFFEWY